jgi:hypothetical protein
MNYQLGSGRVTRGTALIQRSCAVVGGLTVIAHEIYAELRRLNRGGDYGARTFDSRRQHTQTFKAALVQRYRDHGRCC